MNSLVIDKDVGTCVATRRDVVERTRKFKTELSDHERSIRPKCVISKRAPVFCDPDVHDVKVAREHCCIDTVQILYL